MSANVLVTVSIHGNLHNARDYCNERGFADYIVTAQPVGMYTVIMLRMPPEVRDKWNL